MAKEDSRLIVLDMVRGALQLQRERRANMESKAGVLLGFSGAILALMMGGYSILTSLPTLSRLSSLAAVGFLSVAIFYLIWVTRIQKFRIDPDPRSFAERYRLKHSEETIDQLLSILVDSFDDNERKVENIANSLRLAYLLSGCGLACLAFGVSVSLFV